MHLDASAATLRLKSEPFRWRMFAGLEIEFKQMGIYLIDGRGGIVWRGIVHFRSVAMVLRTGEHCFGRCWAVLPVYT